MKKINIEYTNQKSTISKMPVSDYVKLRTWFLNSKSCKTYWVDGETDLLIHKDQIAYMLISDAN